MTDSFNERHAARSRAVCEAMAEAADTGKRALSERERRILDMWPRFGDGECVMVGDEAVSSRNMRFRVKRIEVRHGKWMLNDSVTEGHYLNGKFGNRVKRPAADSWERLEEDAVKEPCDYFGVECDDDRGCSGCPHLHEGRDCTIALQADLVRRAKALAGVEVSE